MKLNLLPTYVGSGRQLLVGIIIGLILLLGSSAMSVMMVADSTKQLQKVKDQANSYDKPVSDAIAYAAKADEVVAPLRDIVRNINLADAMNKHNPVFPAFYDSMFPYIPGFFRITNIDARPNDASTVTLTMTGVIKTHQQYIDLMLALLRIPGATTVSRSGFTPAEPFLPPISEDDQHPSLRKPDEAPLPKDPLDRLNAMIARGGVSGYKNQGNFGDAEPGPRGPMPNYQIVTVTVQVPGNLTTPNPRAALAAGGGGGGGAVVVSGGGGGGKGTGGGGGRRGGGGAGAAAAG